MSKQVSRISVPSASGWAKGIHERIQSDLAEPMAEFVEWSREGRVGRSRLRRFLKDTHGVKTSPETTSEDMLAMIASNLLAQKMEQVSK